MLSTCGEYFIISLSDGKYRIIKPPVEIERYEESNIYMGLSQKRTKAICVTVKLLSLDFTLTCFLNSLIEPRTDLPLKYRKALARFKTWATLAQNITKYYGGYMGIQPFIEESFLYTPCMGEIPKDIN
uniref:Uncharacterized protein n=1 Tax=Oryza punctata TaxID=4537 RepID=A0A0E0JQF8_ORYPU